MLFTVTYRGASGASMTEVVEAASRADCFAKMRTRGVSVLSVKEGASKSARDAKDRRVAKGTSANRKVVPYALGIVLVALAGAGIWWWCGRDVAAQPSLDEDGPKKPSTFTKEVKPARPKPPAVTNAPKAVVVAAPTNAAEEVKQSGPRPGYIRLPTGRDIRCKLPPPGETKQMLIFGEMYEIDSDGNAKSLTPPVFDNRFENSVLALSSEGGGLMPGAAKMIPKDEVVTYLFKNIEIKDDDPEDVIAKKIATAEMKELLKEHLKNGGTWEDFAEKATAFRQTERALESDARMTMAKMLREGDVEGVKMYRDKVNEFLKSKGYRGLKLPKKWLDALGEQK